MIIVLKTLPYLLSTVQLTEQNKTREFMLIINIMIIKEEEGSHLIIMLYSNKRASRPAVRVETTLPTLSNSSYTQRISLHGVYK
jgi:hypothetical protein